jgi:hypothetical protein
MCVSVATTLQAARDGRVALAIDSCPRSVINVKLGNSEYYQPISYLWGLGGKPRTFRGCCNLLVAMRTC